MAAAAVWSRPPLVAYVLQYLDLITQAQRCSISYLCSTSSNDSSDRSQQVATPAAIGPNIFEAARVVWDMVTGPLLHLDGQSLKCPGLDTMTNVGTFFPHWDGCEDLPRAEWQTWIGRPDQPKDAAWMDDFLGARGLSRDVLKSFVELNFNDEDIELAMAVLRQGHWRYHCYPHLTGKISRTALMRQARWNSRSSAFAGFCFSGRSHPGPGQGNLHCLIDDWR